VLLLEEVKAIITEERGKPAEQLKLWRAKAHRLMPPEHTTGPYPLLPLPAPGGATLPMGPGFL